MSAPQELSSGTFESVIIFHWSPAGTKRTLFRDGQASKSTRPSAPMTWRAIGFTWISPWGSLIRKVGTEYAPSKRSSMTLMSRWTDHPWLRTKR